MLFNSYEFIFVFLPVTLLIFFFLAKRKMLKWATFSLVVASFAFYAYWNYYYVGLMLGSILFNYLIGSKIEKLIAKNDVEPLGYYPDNTPTFQLKPKWLLCFGIFINISLLAYYKYFGFFIDSANQILGALLPVPNIVLPLGISFFTFTQIAYLIDAYRGETKGYDPLTYVLFVTFFPHLIAGPILYHKEIIPQFNRAEHFVFSHKNVAIGLTFFIIGLFKKVIIADTLSSWVKPVFDAPNLLTLIDAWIGALAYTFQLYFDFSGYSDMAIGLGLMLNIQLPINFNSPYKALSMIDFWQRWHITLSVFLRNYLYIPLGGNRFGEIKRIRNLFLTMLLGGLWHGAGWTFVVWGGWHGFCLVVNHTWRNFCQHLAASEYFAALKTKKPLNNFSALDGNLAANMWSSQVRGFLAWLVTFVAVVIGWVFFRATTLGDAIMLLQAMAGMNGLFLPSDWFEKMPFLRLLLDYGVQIKPSMIMPDGKWEIIAIFILIIWTRFLPNTQELMHQRWQPKWYWAVGTAMIAIYSLLHLTGVSEFLYFQF